VLAAVLRFTGLGWGLRHPPHMDERVFVENVQQMVEQDDFDHRYYEYPGLFFYLLRPVLARAGETGPRAYLIARGVVAACGVMGCAAVYVLGRLLVGPAVGLLGALLVAVSPLAVHTAHMVRPDVVLQLFVTIGLVALLRVGPRLRHDALAGALMGLATAVKFSGSFLVPSYLIQRALAPGPRVKGVLLAAAATVAVFLLATPYALINAREFGAGVQTQVGHHYGEGEAAFGSGLGMAPAYARAWVRGLGLPAALLALGGAVGVLRADARRWLPLLALPVVTLTVMATQRFLFARHLLPSLAVPALLAGVAVEWMARAAARRIAVPPAVLTTGLGLLAAAVPFVHSAKYVRDIARPGTRDLALDWVEAHVPAGARVLSTVERLGLDARRLEVTEVSRLGNADRPFTAEMHYVLATTAADAQAVDGLVERARFEPESEVSGPVIRVLAVPASVRFPHRLLALSPPMLRSSENPAELPSAVDGTIETLWRTEDPQRPGDWVAVTLPEPTVVSRVELLLGPHGRFAARELQVAVSEDGVSWRDVRSRPARPAVDRQRPEAGPTSQVLVLAPGVKTRFLRLSLRRSGAHRWGIAELRVLSPV
jgi:4-amino-4-deoxy-L-arabinose transferase-like glycosyltransferase